MILKHQENARYIVPVMQYCQWPDPEQQISFAGNLPKGRQRQFYGEARNNITVHLWAKVRLWAWDGPFPRLKKGKGRNIFGRSIFQPKERGADPSEPSRALAAPEPPSNSPMISLGFHGIYKIPSEES